MDDQPSVSLPKWFPDPKFQTGKHVLISRGGEYFHGVAWINGGMIRSHDKDAQALVDSFENAYGKPDTLRIFETKEEAKLAYPNFYL